MPSRELIVLIVRDLGLRSAMVARLSLEGESLLTLSGDPLNPMVDRVAPLPRILVVDMVSLGDGLANLMADNRWKRIIVLGTRLDGLDPGRACLIDPRDALLGVGRELARWRQERKAERLRLGNQSGRESDAQRL